MGRPRIQINIGDKYGLLSVVKETNSSVRKSGREDRQFICKCKCGNSNIRVRLSHLRNKSIKSCGCLVPIVAKATATTHGLSKHPLYDTWNNMHKRCYSKNNKDYINYGARGIKICEAWFKSNPNGLANFILWAENNGYRSDFEIDRKNNDKSYKPKNCRWVKKLVNMNNKSDNRFIDYKGKSSRFSEFYTKYHHVSVSYKTASCRLQRGWNAMDAVRKPKMNQKDVAAARRANADI